MSEYPRRDFLRLLNRLLLTASGLLGLGGLMRFLSYSTETQPKTEFDLGPTADYPVGSRTLLPEIPALLIHDENGLSALSLVCPHLGCVVEPGQEGLICPCHGSRFDPQGVVLRGPAAQPLRALRLEIGEDERLYLFLN
jgi:cytochrome b6-f complex iron-sulfur subunit